MRNKQISGLRFRRQEPVGSYFADFLCASTGIIIEVDGWSHEETENNDAMRQQALERLGFRVLRFTNEDVLMGLEGVVSSIEKVCSQEGDAPIQPPPEGEEANRAPEGRDQTAFALP